jgi:hypothetical protein
MDACRYGDGNTTNFADANGMLAYFDQISRIIASTGFTGPSRNDDAHVIRDKR